MLNCEEQVLTPVVLREEVDDGVKPLRMRVALPKPCIGPCEIVARYALTSSPVAVDGNVHVPLVIPLATELTGNNVVVVPGADQQVEVAPAPGRRSRAGWARPLRRGRGSSPPRNAPRKSCSSWTAKAAAMRPWWSTGHGSRPA